MIVASDRSFRPLGCIMPFAPAFDIFEVHVNGQLVNLKMFQPLGEDTYSFRPIPGSRFSAPGWLNGYSDEDVARTPLQPHGIRYEFMGVAW